MSYPGVYIEEVPSGVRSIIAVPTSIAAFVGRTVSGPVDQPVTINGFGDFERIFGGLWLKSQAGFAVRDFFANGGGQAIIVRLFHAGSTLSDADQLKALDAAYAVRKAAQASAGADNAAIVADAKTKADTYAAEPEKSAVKKVLDAMTMAAAVAGAKKAELLAAAGEAMPALATAALSVGGLPLLAASPGKWGASLRASIDTEGISAETALALGVSKDALFNLSVRDARPGGLSERFSNLTTTESARRIDRVLASSALVRTPVPTGDGTGPWIAKLETLAGKQKALADELAKNPPDEAAITAARAAFATAQGEGDASRMDAVSIAETNHAYKKKALTDAQIAGTGVTEAQATLTAAQTALAGALKAAEDAVSDGGYLKAADFLPPGGEAGKHGLYALDKADLFNLLCIPPYVDPALGGDFDADPIVVSAATAYCEKRRAIHLIDAPPGWTTKDVAKAGIVDFPESRSRNAALYFPRLRQPNLLRENQIDTFAPCGAVAGVIARTDTQRGVWKAAAGLDATLTGVPQLSVPLTDAENGELNPLGINCLRAYPVAGRVVWGARTLRGADQLTDEWKYLPVRRTALFIEESLYRGTQWVVFEPNDEPLWAQIRLNVGAFLNGLFRQGAFQGVTPRDAYFVKCDKETTNQADVNAGIVNIAVGFAPLKPAEFVVIRLQQIAGQIET
ncbi:phage tail sheath C-terminal domain-containing protein [Massilia aurea]|uniref:phage tail sheath family protein n=1 Tax=Massilia aurea TaxID=373040 RepID=UPI00346374F6